MTEWGVVSVIVTLLGIGGPFCAITYKYTTTVTKLTVTLESLQECIKELRESNKESHGRIHCKLDEHDGSLADHDKRITVLENKGEIK